MSPAEPTLKPIVTVRLRRSLHLTVHALISVFSLPPYENFSVREDTESREGVVSFRLVNAESLEGDVGGEASS